MDPIERYLLRRSRRRNATIAAATLFGLSLIVGFARDDWARFDHQSFKVLSTSPDGFTLAIGNTPQPVHLLGIRNVNTAAFADRVNGQTVTLLLDSPQTRDRDHRLRAFAFLDRRNLAVDLLKAGLARADRHDHTLFDGDLIPVEASARKNKTGIWASK